jgi:V/A-type H+-transporting ATPase subunit F
VKFYCIADENTVRGFRLAGIDGRTATSAREAAAALASTAAQPEWSVIVLTQPLAAAIRAQVDAIRLEREWPLIVEVPGPDGPLPGHKSLRQLAQEAVGIRLSEEK